MSHRLKHSPKASSFLESRGICIRNWAEVRHLLLSDLHSLWGSAVEVPHRDQGVRVSHKKVCTHLE